MKYQVRKQIVQTQIHFSFQLLKRNKVFSNYGHVCAYLSLCVYQADFCNIGVRRYFLITLARALINLNYVYLPSVMSYSKQVCARGITGQVCTDEIPV